MRSSLLALASIVVAYSLGAGVHAVTARAATPCWKTVIADWSRDGTIHGSYSTACCRQAMQNAPTDLKIYSTLEDDLQSALRQHSSRRLAGAHATVAALDSSRRVSSLSFLVALVAGLGLLLAACSGAAALVRRRVAR
jgi:hypothetical protein